MPITKRTGKKTAKGFYYDNTVEITLPDGSKGRVNKFDAEKIKAKLKTEKIQAKFGKAKKA